MMACANRWRQAVAPFGLVGLVLGVGLAGCGKPAPPAEPGQAAAQSGESAPGPRAAGEPAARPGQPKLDPRLEQPFKDAVLLDPPPDAQCPPDVTKAGKVVGKLFEAVAGRDGAPGLWDQVRFATPDGKRLNYTARIRTDLGTVTLELWPDVAPNHVRNFVALARAGYYDGLDFDRVHREELVDTRGGALEYVEAGCPLGTGDPAYGSIGYWLKEELNPAIHHEEGTVGAWHAEALESAACKFYITLTKAPWLDGNFTVFGKVVEGLDVVRRIAARPKRSDETDEDRPREPVVIRAVTIQVSESTRAAGPSN
jgi:peptidyl-prolyl cis-trans isomerase B (cyclophilin B)